MARSIHETRKDLAAVAPHGNDDEDARRIAEVRSKINRKRRIKKQVQGERSVPQSPFFRSAQDTILVRVMNQEPYVHYPASPEDIRAVMHVLPKGVTDGLDLIELCLGKGYQSYPVFQRSTLKPDPYTSRLGHEALPGVFMGRALGTYWPRRQRIRLYAYVYEEAMVDRPAWELYLRLKMLSTFVHEVAHHHDHAQRVARGRWLMDTKTKVEMYAERFEHDWTQQYVVPYLLKNYPAEWETLNGWIIHHGGISLPLALLACESRITGKRGRVRVQGGVFSVEGALESLKRHVIEGRPLIETRLRFAEELHWAEYYTEALAILEIILQKFPNDLQAPILKADILVHQREYDAAFLVLKPVISAEKDNVDALRVLADVYEARQEWPELARVTTRLLDRLNVSTFAAESHLLLQRAVARVKLGDYDGAEEDLSWLHDVSRKWVQRRVAALRKEISQGRKKVQLPSQN